MAVFQGVKKEDLQKLKGFQREEPKTVHEELRLKKGEVSFILYSSGKLLLQGKPEAVEKAAKELEKHGIGKKVEPEHFRREQGWIIGTDESLKGDTFGGVVVAGVKANDELRRKLIELGVADSKTLADKEILQMADKIKHLVPCEVKSVLPTDYNKDGNITKMLNQLHKVCADYLFPGKHVVDKFPGCTIGDIQVEKAESKYAEVAAASVLARAGALQQLDYLSAEAGFRLPKGSTHVRLALFELKERGLDFKKFVKIDFSNVQEFLED
jgi:ribonuclease HIII